jgi:hypothetical protein
MKKQAASLWQKQLLFAALTIVAFIFAASSQAFGQKYKPGDKVECDPSGTNTYLKGTVLEYLESDNPVFQGNYYLTRVKIDKWTLYPEGVLCQTERVRLSKTAAPTQKQMPQEENQNPPVENETTAEANAKFKPGDRVECDTMNIGTWFKGTVLPFKENDNPDADTDKTGKYFYIHRVRLDNEASTRPAGGMCFTDRTRLLAGAAAAKPPVDNSVGKVTTDENNTLSADRPILDCPVEQTAVKNGARPNPELIKKIVRCDKGEKPASKGLDGAITVDVTAIQIAAPRRWNPLEDSGDGRINSTVYPVKVTYTVKTFYRSRTVVDENWIRIINFYVNSFGEWQSGSELPVKSPQTKDIPRFP